MGTFLLAYRPFLEPLPYEPYWLVMLLPLVLAVAIVYKAIRTPDLRHLPQQALLMSAEILVFMVLVAAGLWLLTALV